MTSAPPTSSSPRALVLTPTKTGRTSEMLHSLSSGLHSTATTHTPANDGPSPGSFPKGRHITLDFHNIPRHRFSKVADPDSFHRKAAQLIQDSGMTLLGHSCHVFSNTQGITCVFLLSESHLSIHTWPEHGYAGECAWQPYILLCHPSKKLESESNFYLIYQG